MKSLFKKFKNSSKKTKIIVCASICTVVVVVGTLFAVFSTGGNPEESLYGTTIEITELPVTELTYPGLLTYIDGKIPILTKKTVYMKYKASVKFGIKDYKDIKVEDKGDELVISTPHTEMLNDFYIDEGSMEFTKAKRAIFNWVSIDDAPRAIAEAKSKAKEDVGEKFNYDEAVGNADERVKERLEYWYGQNGKKVTVKFK